MSGKKNRQQTLLEPLKLAKMVLSIIKGDFGLPEGFWTGYVTRNYHLQKLGKAKHLICPISQADLETAGKILSECVAVSRTRHQFLMPTNIHNENPRLVLRFIKSLQLV